LSEEISAASLGKRIGVAGIVATIVGLVGTSLVCMQPDFHMWMELPDSERVGWTRFWVAAYRPVLLLYSFVVGPLLAWWVVRKRIPSAKPSLILIGATTWASHFVWTALLSWTTTPAVYDGPGVFIGRIRDLSIWIAVLFTFSLASTFAPRGNEQP
jgi:hypothetical protein